MNALKSLLDNTSQKVACKVHEVGDESVPVVCFFGNLLEFRERRSDIKSDDIGTFGSQVGDLRGVPYGHEKVPRERCTFQSLRRQRK